MKKSTGNLTVSAIIATYNRAALLPHALDSLLMQSRPVDEIIVIDDASTDRTSEVVRHYTDRICYFRNATNSGKSASLNVAIPLATGSHIWLFDDDDVALPDALANHVSYLQANSDIDFSYSDKFIFNGTGDIWQRDKWSIDPLPSIDPDDFFERTLYQMNTLFQGMLVPSRCYRKLSGPFDESLDRCIDHELLLRLAQGFRGGNVGTPGYVYREHGGLRGSAAHQHKGSERYRVMLDYRQQMFKRVRRDYPLEGFTPRFCQDHSLASAPHDLALLQRGCVMLHHGLVEEALTDLSDALPALSPDDYDNPALREMLSRAINIESWIWPNAVRNLAELARLLAATGALSLDTAFARGLYWQSSRARGKGEWVDGARLLGWMALFLARSRYYRGTPSNRRVS